MTKFDTDLASRGWALIAEGASMISLAYAAIEQPAAGGAKSSPPPTSPAPVDFDDLPPLTDADAPYEPQAAETPDKAPLGVCPVHRTAWTVKAGGISKNGKPYKPFWKCSGKTDGAYCNEKPTKAWSDSHPIPLEVAA